MGALKWGLKATLCNVRTIVYNCVLLRPPWVTIVGNHGQLWTSTLSPHLLSPHLDCPKRFCCKKARFIHSHIDLPMAQWQSRVNDASLVSPFT